MSTIDKDKLSPGYTIHAIPCHHLRTDNYHAGLSRTDTSFLEKVDDIAMKIFEDQGVQEFLRQYKR